jgi:hypothetical protein
MQKALLPILLLFLAHCSQKEFKNLQVDPDFAGQFYENRDFGFAIKLYPEYEKIREEEESVLFSSDIREGINIVILFWKGAKEIKQFYEAVFENKERLKDREILSGLGIEKQPQFCEEFNIENGDSYIIVTKERKGFRSYFRVRLEIFPKKEDTQITIIARSRVDKIEKVWSMFSTIKIEP